MLGQVRVEGSVFTVPTTRKNVACGLFSVRMAGKPGLPPGRTTAFPLILRSMAIREEFSCRTARSTSFTFIRAGTNGTTLGTRRSSLYVFVFSRGAGALNCCLRPGHLPPAERAHKPHLEKQRNQRKRFNEGQRYGSPSGKLETQKRRAAALLRRKLASGNCSSKLETCY